MPISVVRGCCKSRTKSIMLICIFQKLSDGLRYSFPFFLTFNNLLHRPFNRDTHPPLFTRSPAVAVQNVLLLALEGLPVFRRVYLQSRLRRDARRGFNQGLPYVLLS